MISRPYPPGHDRPDNGNEQFSAEADGGAAIDPGSDPDLERLGRRAAVQVSVLRLTRALAPLVGVKEVGRRVVDAVARALHARIASLAVREPEGEQLQIVAALGYPLELVEHVRIPGAPGVLSTVYTTRVPLRVDDVTQVPGVMRRRPRYATSSCIAWPIVAGTELLGIVCVSDRDDRRPFTRTDMWTLRALAAPVALALSREHARNQAETLAHAAAVDPLTGLFNRRYFHHRLAEELERSHRHGLPVALAMVDLDGFKAINDMYGHLVGDNVIRQTAEMLRRSVRVFDICTRFGGDEFAIVMPGSSQEAASRIAQRMRERIETERFAGHLHLHVTASLGVAVAEAGAAPSDLIARADRALYVAKRMGKNRVSG